MRPLSVVSGMGNWRSGCSKMGLVLGLLALPLALERPALRQVSAHQVRVADDIGGTLHIEPDDRPRAGQSVLMWFALTRKGGIPLQLDECDCTVQVFQLPLDDRSEALTSPQLQAVEAENYSGIPGANVTFPEAGAYAISISGQPVEENDFRRFELRFDVTVIGQ